MGFSTNRTNKVLDHIVGKTELTFADGAFYVGLSNATPTASAVATEPSGGAYARLNIPAADWSAAASGSITTANNKSFTTAAADWLSGADMNYAMYFDHITNTSVANYIAFQQLTTAKPVTNGDIVTFNAGSIVISIT